MSPPLGLWTGLWLITGLAPHGTEHRWPTWPSEVAHVASPLHATGRDRPDERMRVAAVQALETYTTPAIADEVVHALDDPSPQVRTAALQLCYERMIHACLPAASTLWTEASAPVVRMAALKVLALDAAPSRAAILLSALRDSDDQIRAKAAGLLGSAALPPSVRSQARNALLAKLADVSALVRREATQSLGFLGPGRGTLAIARLLEDPDPSVRAAAARALGQHRDPRAVAALQRIIAAGGETEVSQAAIEALALLPSEEVDRTLLRLLDTPPRGLSHDHVARSIGRRLDPARVLIDGLIDRLREPSLRDAALVALLHLGARAKSALLAAQRRGLAPLIEVEVERLLQALEVPRQTPEAWALPLPGPKARRAWHEALAPGPVPQRFHAAVGLAELAPPWLPDAAAGVLTEARAAALWRPWALVIALTPQPMPAHPRYRLAWTKLAGWARDDALAVSDRCLAVAALAATPEGTDAASVLAQLREHRHPRIRGCATLALARQRPNQPMLVATMLRDPDPAVRTSAAIALAAQRPRRVPSWIRSTLAALQVHDEAPAVRAATRWALQRLTTARRPHTLRTAWLAVRAPEHGWAHPEVTIPVTVEGAHVPIPVQRHGPIRWAVVPGLHGAQPMKATPLVPTEPGEPTPP